MGKRLVRIFNKDITANFNTIIDKEVNVIMKNNSTLHGIITKSENNIFKIKDMLNNKHEVTLDDIVEIIYDREAAF
jgi:hypothetical protein